MFGIFFTNHIEKRKYIPHKFNFRGFLFSEIIFRRKEEKLPLIRFALLRLFVIFAFFATVARLISLQIMNGENYRKLAEGNRVFEKRVIAPRGIITDRYGEELVINEPRFVLRDGNKIREIPSVEALKLETSNLSEFKKVEITGKRKYLAPLEFAHIIGYLGEISQNELKNRDDQETYQIGDSIGRSGVEQSYEKELKGKNGIELYEVKSDGAVVNKLGTEKAIPGEKIKLTIDSDLQRVAYEALANAKNDLRYLGGPVVKGAVIVSDVGTGEILAMVSSPALNPDNIAAALKDGENYPFMNRAISATYPPGSTFKLVVSTAGLESGRLTKNTLIEDIGVIKIGQWEFPTWSSIRDGMMDIVKGIKRSNDIFFYKAGEMIGLSRIVQYAKMYGAGDKLGIDLPAEAAGNLPSDEWKMQVAKEHWYLGDTYHLAIGQGYILTTPLQVNMWTNAIASQGKLYRPHVVINKTKKDQDYLIRDLKMKPENLGLIWKGMKEACQTGGTGWPLFDFKIPVACKTGTAEYGLPVKTHAWFTAFAPADKPEIAVTVLIEDGGQGSDVAAPVTRKVLEKYFEGRIK